jgi:cytochrome c-type biogenesis protein CcmH/NrfG
MPFPYTFTFYSYKGGVGRSLALLNTAYVLASWGRHVLIVDMDLEAPGVGGYLTRLKELSPAPAKDLVDLLALALEPGTSDLPPVSEFIRSVLPEKLESLTPELGEVGRLDVLAPDTDREYTQRLATLALQELSRERIIDLGQKLHAYFKSQRFSLRPLGIEDFEDPIESPYDYILVDSRTGFTEIGGLCVGPLSDRLVVLTGLNDQNIAGTMHFLQEVGITPAPRQDSQPWDDADSIKDPEAAPGLGPKPTIVVATPVPSGEIEFKRNRLAVLEEKIGIKPLRISYHPHLALMEEIFVRDFTDEPPAADYLRLAVRMTAQVQDSADQLVRATVQSDMDTPLNGELALRLLAQRPEVAPVISFRALSGEKAGKKWQRRIAAVLARSEPNRAEMLVILASIAIEEAKDGLSDNATEFFVAAALKCVEATSLKPDFAEAFGTWGIALSGLARSKSGDQADQLFSQSFEKYAQATRLKPDFANAFSNWGIALSEFARSKSGDQADQLFSQSFEKYAQATRLKPDFAEAFGNWGNALSELAQTKFGDQADQFFSQSIKKCAEAARLKPDFAAAFSNWGIALSGLAKSKSGDQAEQLFSHSFEKNAEATRLKPDYANAFGAWGAALSEFATTKSGDESDQLFLQSCEKYAEATRLKPDFAESFGNWGIALAGLAQTKSGDQADQFFSQSIEKCAEAARLKPDFANAFENWGHVLYLLAKTKSGDQADRLFSQSIEKCAEAARLKPDFAEAFAGWGNSLSALAKSKPGDQAGQLFSQSFEKYAQATRLKPDFANAFINWGAALSELATTKSGDEADQLILQSIDKYTQATRLKPDFATAFSNWGVALSALAKTKSGDSADQLFSQSFEKYAEATRLKPDYTSAFSNWGVSLSDFAKIKSGDEARELFLSATAKFQMAGIEGLYNFACAEALQGDPSAAVASLRKLVASGRTVSAAQIEADSDFEAIRNDPEFIAFLDELRG